MNGYLYILQSGTNGHYYIGSTGDPDRRLSQHNVNAVTATRGKGPWKRMALVCFADEKVSRAAERFIKRQKSRGVIKKIISGEFIWPDVYPK